MSIIGNDSFIFFIAVILVVILVSIQFTLNKILKVLNEIKAQRK